MFDASDQAFDQIAVSIEMAIEAGLGKAIGVGRNNGLPACCLDLYNEVVGVVPFVRDNGLGGTSARRSWQHIRCRQSDLRRE